VSSDGSDIDACRAALTRNPALVQLAARLEELALPGWYLAGGCLFQTVWNLAHGFEPLHGIQDYDIFYFDAANLSAAAERAVAARLAAELGDVGVPLDVRNQARVHTWYEAEFGTPSPVFSSSEDGIDHFLALCCSLGLRRVAGELRIYAPHGCADLFGLIVRPNPLRSVAGEALRGAYESKTRRWLQRWPRLRVVPWS
jgi:hypothetical protein